MIISKTTKHNPLPLSKSTCPRCGPTSSKIPHRLPFLNSSLACAPLHNTIRYLIAKKASIESYKLNEWTPLMYSATAGHLEVCKELIASKASTSPCAVL